MFREVPYETLLRDHPVQVQEAIQNLRTSRSKFRNDPPESFKWGYDWCVLIEGSGTLAQMLARVPEPEPSIDERVERHRVACRVKLVMQKKTSRFISEPLSLPRSSSSTSTEKVSKRGQPKRPASTLSHPRKSSVSWMPH